MPTPRAVVAIALAVALATVLPLQGGGESARAEVRSATGPLVATEDGALLVAGGLRPGDVRVGEVTVTNTGDTAGAFTLSQADRIDSPTPAGPLSSVLELTVSDLTAGRVVYAGKLAAMASVALGDLAQGAAHRYRFAVAFPSGAPAFDNQLQVAATTVSFVWSAGAVAPAPTPPVATPPAAAPTAPPSATLATASRPTARLVAAARQRGRVLRLQLTCQAACRARFTATARARGASLRVRAVSRTLRKAGRTSVRLALPRRSRGARAVIVRIGAHIAIDGRRLLIRKTVHLALKRH